MADKNQQLQSNNTKSDFGKGWAIIIYCMIMFWFLIGFSIDGQNIVIDVFAGANWEKLGFADQTALHAKLLELAMWTAFPATLSG